MAYKPLSHMGLWIMGLLLTLPLAANADLQGSLGCSSFTYETYGEDAHRELDLINRLSLRASNFAPAGLSLHFQGTWRGEMLFEDSEDPETRILRGYASIAPLSGLKASFGRQWLYAGVRTSMIDGAKLEYRLSGLRLTAYTGMESFSTEEDATFMDMSRMSDLYGLHLLKKGLPFGDLGLSLSGRATEDESEEAELRMGATLSRPGLFYELRYGDEKVYFSHLNLRRDLGEKLQLGITWNYRSNYQPDLAGSWILQYFEGEEWFAESISQDRNEFRAQLNFPCRMIDGARWNLALVEIFPAEGDRGDGLDLAFNKGALELGLRMQQGYRGDRMGFYGSYRKLLKPGTSLYASAGHMSYRYGNEELGEEYSEDDYSLSSRLGLDHACRRFPGLHFNFALEHLTNPRAEYELRFLAAARKDFSRGKED